MSHVPPLDRQPFAPAALVRAAALAGTYWITARVGLSLGAVNGVATAVWPPTGISLAALVLGGTGLWPGVACGAFLANVSVGVPALVAVGIAAGNTFEALCGAYLLRRVEFRPSLERIKDVISLIGFAAFVSPIISATIGATSSWLGGVVPGGNYAAAWATWWLGDGMGDLVVAPVLLTWSSLSRLRRTLRRPGESGLLFVLLVVVSALVFAGSRHSSAPYVAFPFVVWAALRSGQPGVALTVFLTSAIAIWGAARGIGPFAGHNLDQGLLLLQTFMGVVAITALLLGAAIAERKSAEQALVEADRSKNQFLAMLSHELRNPLAAIRNGVEILRQPGLPDTISTTVRDMISRQVAHVARLVDDLLDLSRLTRGKILLHAEGLDLREVVRAVVEDHRDRIAAEGLNLSVELPDQPVRMHGDPTRLAQIVGNVIDNALKFTNSGGRIDIELAADADHAAALLKVRDTGIGMDADMLGKIFDVFAQADRSLSRTRGGLGLGLALVKQLVELHGGQICAASAGPDQGAEFTIRLPLVPSGFEVRGR